MVSEMGLGAKVSDLVGFGTCLPDDCSCDYSSLGLYLIFKH